MHSLGTEYAEKKNQAGNQLTQVNLENSTKMMYVCMHACMYELMISKLINNFKILKF